MKKISTKKLIYRYFIYSLLVMLFGLFVLLGGYFYLGRDLPSLEELERFEPELISRVYASDGTILKEFYTQRRVLIPLEEIPSYVVDALLATEDRDFYDHWGMNVKRTVKAFIVGYGGASTITQQLARTLHLNLERSYIRKLKELIIAIHIEQTYTKDEILEMYLNSVHFGHGTYGIQAAAKLYFNKDVQNLNLDEGAMLIGLLPAPARFTPIHYPDVAIQRRNLVLRNMAVTGKISKWDYANALNQNTSVASGGETLGIAPYFTEYVRQEISDLGDRYNINIYRDGLEIYTTLNSRMQLIAEEALQNHLRYQQKKLDRRLLANREEMIALLGIPADSVAHLSNDSLFHLLPKRQRVVQGSFFAIDPENGAILVMIGGRDFEESKFNRAIQAERQPGSIFKPFVYTAAVDNGFSPSDQVLNQPVVIIEANGTRWTPTNYNGKTGGLMTMREGIQWSTNLVSIRWAQKVTPAVVRDYARKMGLTTPIDAVESISLGTSPTRLSELVAAYAVFPNQGVWNKPFAITRVLDRNGHEVYRSPRDTREVLSRETAYIMTDMLRTVVDAGTGGSIRWKYQFTGVPAGGKTGTTQNFTDALFVGFTKNLCAGTWVGVDDPRVSLGEGQAGAVAALPIWATFMKKTYDELKLPVKDFIMPPGVRSIEICSETKKLPTEYCPTTTEIFNVRYAPKTRCTVHGKNSSRSSRGVDF